MGCRPFAAIALVMVGLVAAVTSTSARVHGTRGVSATATILTRATTPDDQNKALMEKIRARIGNENITAKYIDKDGFVTSPANPQRRRIIIVDLP